jgi:hypothetical protein
MQHLERDHYKRLASDFVASIGDYPEERFEGRGIVLCGGGARYFPCAWVCVRMLRHLGVSLPIELWYRGPNEMSREMIELVEPYGVRCIDAYGVAHHHPILRLDGWELKAYAILNSRFREVLYLDCDNVPVYNPETLFDHDAYRSAGAVFWPDRYRSAGDIAWLKREAWDVCEVPYRDEPEIEAGQLLVDKSRAWHPLMLALHYNEHSDFYYRYFYGDKDTFHLAWRRLDVEYALIPHPLVDTPGALVIYQRDFEGNIIFQHRNCDKWGMHGANYRIPGFAHEATCLGFIDELRDRWHGTVRRIPDDFTAVERATFEEIVQTRAFTYRLIGADARVLEMMPDFSIDAGWGEMERGWMVEEDKDGKPLLIITNDGGVNCFLRRAGERRWQGSWRSYERYPVVLEPAQ